MREEVSSAEEGGEAEPNEIDVYEVQMIQRTADWIRRPICLIEGEWLVDEYRENGDE